jgi:hypothetical protein
MGNEEIRNETSQKYFSDLTSNSSLNLGNSQYSAENLNEKVSLRILLTNIQNEYDYSLQIYSINGPSNLIPLNQKQTLEKKSSTIAELTTSIIMNYYFEREQKLLIDVDKYTNNGLSQKFSIKTTLGCIMGSRRNTFNQLIPQSNGENITITAEKIGQGEDIFILDFDVQPNKPVDWTDIKNKLIFKLNSGNNSIYKSECISDNGTFNSVKIPAGILNKGMQFIFIDSKNETMADITTNIKEMITGKTIQVQMSKNRCFNLVSKSKLKHILSFIDYLKAGVQIGLNIAIDFTGSNGHPSSKTSLHYIGGPEPNQYERAIYSCGNICAYYDYDQMFPCYGFGAKINNVPTQIFNLNFEENPNIHLIPNVIESYHKALNYLKLWGPTNFGPILNSTINMVKKENDKYKYTILMILTDGIIDDVDYTINCLVDASFLPISVIIIGIGKADFTAMNVLDADENPLINDKGVKAVRDIVQFVPFLKYESNPEKLAEEVLKEIPKQIIEYYEQNDFDIDPNRLMI